MSEETAASVPLRNPASMEAAVAVGQGQPCACPTDGVNCPHCGRDLSRWTGSGWAFHVHRCHRKTLGGVVTKPPSPSTREPESAASKHPLTGTRYPLGWELGNQPRGRTR